MGIRYNNKFIALSATRTTQHLLGYVFPYRQVWEKIDTGPTYQLWF